MIEIIINQPSSVNQVFAPTTIEISGPDRIITESEISTLWKRISGGNFERKARTLLTDLCRERGFDAVKLLD